MPLYEYRCLICDTVEEKLCSYSSPEEYDCPACGSVAGMRRQMSVPAIAFVGGGWYAQGYSDSPPDKTNKPQKPQCEGSEKSVSPPKSPGDDKTGKADKLNAKVGTKSGGCCGACDRDK
ncbi:MAG: zinc ribbon domain-containing protein [Holophagales bacterium]|jgi:putative FmdB family regulatory protein|nr:zinc ribbon domain-containing protein [Holophagales bacterium]